MATIATCKQFIEQHPNAGLIEVMTIDSDFPSNFASWFSTVQNIYIAWLGAGHTTTLDEFSLAMYTYWSDPANVTDWVNRITSTELTNALTDLKTPNADFSAPTTTPAFPNATQITSAVNNYYMDIVITVDANSILEVNNNNSNITVYVGEYITMHDNHKQTSSGENTDELSSQGLQPNMTITWTAVSKYQNHAIELTAFEPNAESRFEELAPMPVQLTGMPNVWCTKAKPQLPTGFSATYHFNFQIDNGTATYWFDPYIGDTDV